MPCMTMGDTQPKEFIVQLAPPPIVEAASADMVWGMGRSEMSYLAAPSPQELFPEYHGGVFAGLGDYEMERLNRLPGSLVRLLAEEAAEEPEFVQGYLVTALQHPNPYRKITDDIAEAVYSAEVGMGDLGKSWFKKAVSKIRSIHKKITPKFMQNIHKKISGAVKKTWQKYGNVIIGVAGAVLAPFTGGASLAAASVLVAAKTMYDKRKAAIEAKKYAKKEAAALNAEAKKQQDEVAAQVDQFYRDNQAWFLQYDMTPEKWAKLDLDHKIEFINAGAEGRLPASSRVVNLPAAQVEAQTQQTVAAAQNAGISPSAVMPPAAAATGGGGYASPPSYSLPGAGYDTSSGGAPASPADQAQAAASAPGAQFEGIVEGQVIGTYGSADEAFNAILAASKPGDRLEILANGQSLGKALRTQDGAVEVPPGQESKVASATPEQMQKIVNEADESVNKGGGFPWWLLAAAGGAALALKG